MDFVTLARSATNTQKKSKRVAVKPYYLKEVGSPLGWVIKVKMIHFCTSRVNNELQIQTR